MIISMGYRCRGHLEWKGFLDPLFHEGCTICNALIIGGLGWGMK